MNSNYKELKEKVYQANLDLVKNGLVLLTWGNASLIDREKKVIVIKPSGVPYEKMTVDSMVVIDLDGNKIEGDFSPSSDTPTHVQLYKAFEHIGAIVHTHSTYATAYAQSGKSIEIFGTTHADHFHSSIPCTKFLEFDKVVSDYEKNTGILIANHFNDNKTDYLACPSILVKGHGPFCWGTTINDAVANAIVLEEVAKMTYLTKMLNHSAEQLPEYIIDKHYKRKHGKNSYYGQKNK